MRSRLGECLVRAGLITADQLRSAIAEQKRSGDRLGVALVRLGAATEEQIARAIAAQLGYRYVDPLEEPPDPAAARLIDKELASRAACIALRVERNILTVAMAEPLAYSLVPDLERRTGYRIQEVVASRRAILAAIETAYARASPANEPAADESLEMAAPAVDLLESIVDGAIDADATDIHIEPDEDGISIRYRIDGALREVMNASASVHEELAARIKIMAGLDVAEKLLPQAGRMRLGPAEGAVDFRVTTLRTINGERIVMRVLDRRRGAMPLEALGLTTVAEAEIRRWLRRNHGLIAIAGPSASGKTTTLYAAAQELDRSRGTIVSIEDPIEGRLPGAVQVQVDTGLGLSFAGSLRAALAQDAGIVVIGDLADAETATLAALTARSDRLVVAAIGAEDAVSGLLRLTELVGSSLAAASVVGVAAQRLVRRLCQRCRIEHAVPAETLRAAGIAGAPDAPRFFKPVGCDECHYTGYRGRIGVYEVMPVTDTVRELIVAGAPAASVRAAAVAGGLITLPEDGMAKAGAGITSLDELLRACGEIGETRALCGSCGGAIEPDFSACPRCGARLGRNCSQCGRALQPGWSVCPYCAAAADAGGASQKRGTIRLFRNSDRNDAV